MHYIKDIFEGKKTQHAHNKFVRYSKGSFVGPLLQIKQNPSSIKVNTSFHLVDELLHLIAEVLGNEVVRVKGSIVWNTDLTEELAQHGIKYSKVTKTRGIFKYVLDNDVHFKDFVDTMSGYNILLSVKHPKVSISSKSAFPKPNKEFTSDFCKCEFPKEMASRIFEEFAFDINEKSPKTIIIEHHIDVNDIKLPQDSQTFEEARRLATREGSIKRKITVDGTLKESSTDFSV